MITEDLIVELASRAAAVKPLRSPAVRLVIWSAIALAGAALGMAAFGVRPQITDLLRQPEFLATAIASVGTASLAAAASLVLAVPGAERSALLRWSAVLLVVVWGAVVAAAVVRAGAGVSGAADWPICFFRVLLIGSIPAWALFAMLRRAAPLRRVPTSGLAALAATAIAAGAIQFICPLTAPAHALFGHFTPVLVAGGLGVWASARLLR